MYSKKLILTMLAALFTAGASAIEYRVTVPQDARLIIGTKSKHYVDFTPEEPTSVETNAGLTTYTFNLTSGKVYNYRTWKAGGITRAGYFTMNSDASKCPVLSFIPQDYDQYDPKSVKHSPQSNAGYETGDIFVNINPAGYLRLEQGQTYDAHAMRTWELTDNSVNNYFIEPDFHYTVLDLKGNPSDDVITVETAEASPWAKLKAVGKGSAIVLVSYDAIVLNYYSGTEKKEYLGGEFWGAIWPENTAVYVVTVDTPESLAKPNMVINEKYNEETLKNAGKYVDAEHDVFYYLDNEPGYYYTFTPEGAAHVDITYPQIGAGVEFSGFSDEGVTKNSDGSYTVLLKNGRQIVRLLDEAGNATFQVLTARECSRVISNESREGSTTFQPGDKIKIQYSGLYHPANKLAGIYNMSAYVTYNGTPNGTSLIQGSGQYTFGSAESAQAITVKIPEDFDAESNSTFLINEGVIQVNGYGDPIGNHRIIDPAIGRSPNFNAVAHKTYFGALPDVEIAVIPMKFFTINVVADVKDAEISVVYNGEKTLEPVADGTYRGTYGNYTISAKCPGFRCSRVSLTLGEDDADSQTVEIAMTEGSEGMWNGSDITVVTPDEEGVYHINTGAQLAFIAQLVNENGKKVTPNVVLDNDIDLGDYDWTPIGNSTNYFKGTFDGKGHIISGLYIDNPSLQCAALVGDIQGISSALAVVSNVMVEGYVRGDQYVAGVVAKVDKYAEVNKCANLADVSGSSHVGGVVGYLSTSTKCSLTDCYNLGDIYGSSSAGGVVGYNNASAVVTNVYSTGEVSCDTQAAAGACVGGTTKKTKVSNAYSTRQCEADDNSVLVSNDQMASGEVAYKLGKTFSQTIGSHPTPVFNGAEVYYDPEKDLYYNIPTGVAENLNDECAVFDVYDLSGRAVLHNATRQEMRRLSHGIYIVRGKSEVRKVILHE